VRGSLDNADRSSVSNHGDDEAEEWSVREGGGRRAATGASTPPGAGHLSPRPAFAAVIPTYQREGTVGRAIESVLAQTFAPREVIVVDDGSTDGTRSLLARFTTVRTIVQEQSGSAAARNRGARAASAEWIAFLDSDDWWEPDHLERLAGAIEETGGAADLYFDDTAVVMHTFEGDDSDTHVGSLWAYANFAPTAETTLFPDASECVLLPIQPIMLQSSAIRRDRYLALGGMSERLALRHDTHLFLLLGLGRPACAVAGIGAQMTAAGGDDRLTRRVPPTSLEYWNETAILYGDVVRHVRRGTDAYRVLTERIAIAHWRRGRIAFAAHGPRAALRPLVTSLRTRPSVIAKRFFAKLSRRAS